MINTLPAELVVGHSGNLSVIPKLDYQHYNKMFFTLDDKTSQEVKDFLLAQYAVGQSCNLLTSSQSPTSICALLTASVYVAFHIDPKDVNHKFSLVVSGITDELTIPLGTVEQFLVRDHLTIDGLLSDDCPAAPEDPLPWE